MAHRKLTIAYLWVDDVELRLKFATVLGVRKVGTEHLDWECVAYPLFDDLDPLESGVYQLRATTLDGPTVAGPAMLVRSTGASHVWRGAGSLDGFVFLGENPPDSPSTS